MSRSLLPGLALSIALAAAFHHVTLGAGTSCESLASLKLPNTTITFAQTVAAGAFTPPGPPAGTPPAAVAGPSPAAQLSKDLPAFCRVAATAPTMRPISSAACVDGELQGFRVMPRPATGKRVDP
jgi:hypothetical protein